MLELINIVAIAVAPVVAVLITRYLQTKSERRRDKNYIFRTLMTFRGQMWCTQECVNCLNVIEVVFFDDSNVVAKWKDYLDKCSIPQPNQHELEKMERARYKLLEAMAKGLGYSDCIDWDTIQHPYVPVWLTDATAKQQKMFETQLSVVDALESSLKNDSLPSEPRRVKE